MRNQAWVHLAEDCERARARVDSLDRLMEWPAQGATFSAMSPDGRYSISFAVVVARPLSWFVPVPPATWVVISTDKNFWPRCRLAWNSSEATCPISIRCLTSLVGGSTGSCSCRAASRRDNRAGHLLSDADHVAWSLEILASEGLSLSANSDLPAHHQRHAPQHLAIGALPALICVKQVPARTCAPDGDAGPVTPRHRRVSSRLRGRAR